MRATAHQVAAAYSPLPEVLAAVVSGSQATGVADGSSDIDVYVYSDIPLTIGVRASVAHDRAAEPEVDNRFWEAGDEWLERQTGIKLDVTFRTRAWIQDRLARVAGAF
jgi:predicted nucleotidyltransferase